MPQGFIVTTKNKAGETVGLRGTVFAFHMSRTTIHDTRAEAEAAWQKASAFYPKRGPRAVKVEITEIDVDEFTAKHGLPTR